MNAMTQKLGRMTGAVLAIALLSGCATEHQIASGEGAAPHTRLTTAPPGSPLVREQIVEGQKRCFYKHESGEFFTAVKPVESCSTQFAHQGEQWDAVSQRPR
jgi:hypothetical protein